LELDKRLKMGLESRKIKLNGIRDLELNAPNKVNFEADCNLIIEVGSET